MDREGRKTGRRELRHGTKETGRMGEKGWNGCRSSCRGTSLRGRFPHGSGNGDDSRRDMRQTHCAAKPNAARCDGRCSALRRPMHRIALAVLFKRNCRQGMLLCGMERGEPSVAAAIHSAKGASAFFAQCLSLAPEACQIVIMVALCHQFAAH